MCCASHTKAFCGSLQLSIYLTSTIKSIFDSFSTEAEGCHSLYMRFLVCDFSRQLALFLLNKICRLEGRASHFSLYLIPSQSYNIEESIDLIIVFNNN